MMMAAAAAPCQPSPSMSKSGAPPPMKSMSAGFSLGLSDLSASLFGSSSSSAPPPPPPAPCAPAGVAYDLNKPMTGRRAAAPMKDAAPCDDEAPAPCEDGMDMERAEMAAGEECYVMKEEEQAQPEIMPIALETEKESKECKKKMKADAPSRTDDQKMDELLKYKKVDGSFTYSSAAMNVCGWQYPSMTVFASRHDISEELAFNLWVLKFLKSDSMKANKKFVMIVRNLEKWLNESLQLHFTNKNTNLSNLLSDVSLQEESEAGK
jgi:hypothetical protein